MRVNRRALPRDCQLGSGDIGVGWGQLWGQKSSSIARAAPSRISLRTWAYLLRVIAGSAWPSILETMWSGTPCRKASVAEVVEAHVYGEVGFSEELLQRAHNRVPAADLAFRVREDQAGVRPRGRRHPLLELPSTVCLEDLDGAGADTDLALLAGLGGGDTRLRVSVGGAPNGNGGFAGEVDVLPP